MCLEILQPVGAGAVLLVGEGDFSFSASLAEVLGGKKIVATCFEENNPDVENRQTNMATIRCLGGCVYTDVDARRLDQHPGLGRCAIECIVFNFPHTGGKMKIGENRRLLRDFFVSAGRLLGAGGRVLVTLCRGQGGTPAEDPPRRFDDTWQVVHMAAHGGLLLRRVEPFRATDFPAYAPVGYRGGKKAFCTDGALVHVFEVRSVPTLASTDSPGILERNFLAEELGSRLRLKGHPLRLALDALEAALGHRLGHPLLPREAGRRSLGPLATCALALRPSPAPSPLQPPEEHLLVICAVGTSTRDAVVAALSEACPPKASWHWADEASGRLIGLERLALAACGQGDWRLLLRPGDALFPPAYTHDLSFWLPEHFEDCLFARVVSNLLGDVLESLELVDRFSADGRLSRCYRLVYRSLNRPLGREAARDLHLALGPALQCLLGLQVR
ncbi:hypothetical protein HPB47_009122 [Ixodes persulcatus]|uniref:Uncharacterized protein n=1 Tax=Ixodes persulcatus TaxID=34615 RepID=A0AC60P355_IXOPE|nr:hypothetical protein HPB47_009122 [Ixodes persulcatus]